MDIRKLFELGSENVTKKIKFFHDEFFNNNKENDFCYLNNLPSELLWIIFEKVPERDYPGLMLVCKRWKEIIEKFHVFKSSKVFGYPRTKSELELALTSKRKIDLLIVVTNPDYQQQINYIGRILSKDENYIAKCCMLLKNENNNNSSLSTDILIKYLEKLQDLEVLHLNFHRLFFDVADIPILKFNNLSFLSITDYSYKIVRKCLISFKIPQLKIFKIKSDYHCHRHTECDNIFKFLNNNSEKIQEVDVQLNFCTFKWTPESLELRPCRETRNELAKFLMKSRVCRLKRLSIVMTYDPNMYNFIYRDASHLESFFISFTFTIIVGLDLCCTMSSVKLLHLEYFQFSDENIVSLARIFPNIESLHVRFSRSGKLSDEHKRLIRELFQLLKEAKEFHWDFLVSTF